MYYWFFGDTLRDGRPVPPDGEWLTHKGPLELCASGLHASRDPFNALHYAPGPWVAEVHLDGQILTSDDKVCAERRRILRRMDATALLRQYACDEALRVIHLWDAPSVVVDYLHTQNESIRHAARAAAWHAAWDAAWHAASDAARVSAWHAAMDAARVSAWDAAWHAAWAAAFGAARDRFNARVRDAFEELDA